MLLYALLESEKPLFVVSIDDRPWLPVKPRLCRQWLRYALQQTLRDYFTQRAALVIA